jgi:LmbE family N-acetylglucosaminyl deacetylase
MSADFAAPTWGEVDPGAFGNILVLSPHFDDAAMGAGHLLMSYPGSTVATVMGGWPAAYPDPPGEWDALGGFKAGDDVVAVRREEDRAAMAILGAEPVWLDEFTDHTYLAPDDRPGAADVAPALVALVDRLSPTAVFAPMGLANPDHVVVHEASLLARAERPGPVWFCYEDSGYKHIPGMLAWRVARLLKSQPWPTPAIVPHTDDEERKRRAIYCYATQITPLKQEHGLAARLEGRAPEQFWRLDAPPKGWEALADFV